jgi:predicted enzyme related to lactoylglutathione lyase
MNMDMNNGDVCWFDIPVTDFEVAKSFYGELLGWKFEAMGDPKNIEYWLIKIGDKTAGGFRKPQGTLKETDSPTIYFSVDKLDPAILRAKKLGATLVGERVDIGNNMGSFQWMRDHSKNLVAIWAHS